MFLLAKAVVFCCNKRMKAAEVRLFEAAETVDVPTLRAMLLPEILCGGRLVNSVGDEESIPLSAGKTPLHAAVLAYNGENTEAYLEAVRLLLAAGANVNAADAEGVTPLHWLVIHGSRDAVALEVLRLLLAAGADVEQADKDGWTPLISAAHYQNVTLMPALLLAGADVNAQDALGKTPAAHATRPQEADLLRAAGGVAAD